MKIRLNGEDKEVKEGFTILTFLGDQEINPDRVVVEHNRRLVNREEWDSVPLKENDELEVLAFVGGG